MEAAFFDLDKTVIARPSMMAFAPAFRRGGLVNRRTLLRGACVQLVYVRWGAGPRRLARIRNSALTVATGWNRAEVRRIVEHELMEAIDPITYRGIVELLEHHRRAGRAIYLVSAAPEEIVIPVAAHLGLDGAVASRAAVGDNGCYTGQMECYNHGEAKAAAMVDLAARQGFDLSRSWAYSDSISDLAMLEAVGHPVAVNADRALRRMAHRRDWEVLEFTERLGAAGEAPPLHHAHRVLNAAMASSLAAALTTGGALAARRWLRGPTLAEG